MPQRAGGQISARASSRAPVMSSMCSSPMERRTSSGVSPALRWSSSESCEWVVLAGWMIRLLASPTLARMLNSLMLSTSLMPSALPPLTPKTTIPPAPSGRYFSASPCDGSPGSPG